LKRKNLVFQRLLLKQRLRNQTIVNSISSGFSTFVLITISEIPGFSFSTVISVISGFSSSGISSDISILSDSIVNSVSSAEITVEKQKPGISEIVIETKVEKPEETELTIESDKIEISELILKFQVFPFQQ
jgi:hypothetical protein